MPVRSNGQGASRDTVLRDTSCAQSREGRNIRARGFRAALAVMRTERIEESTAEREEARPPRLWLVRIGCAAAPLTGPELIQLDGRERLVLGRRGASAQPTPDRVECQDPWMSGEHAALERTEDGWDLVDLGSSNGTLFFGQRRSSVALGDGDIFETGSTFWMFRSMVLSSDLPDLDENSILTTLHPPLANVIHKLQRVARTRVPVMLLGATGTGKEVLARAIHDRSGRSGPFVAINTAAVQGNLVASELFGVERGAHSMADRSRVGQIRTADGGTLLLDEIGDMPLEVQVSLLRVLQESEVIPVGGDSPVKVDVRFICATHQDLKNLVAKGDFRADLYARLKGTVLEIPPLRERAEDIGLLVARFLQRFDGGLATFSPAAYRALLTYEWPLNVRELEKTIETALAVCEGRRVEPEHLPEEIRGFKPETPERSGPTTSKDRQRELVRLLTAYNGNVSAVARTMGYSRMQVHRWIRQFQLDPSLYRDG